MKLIKEVLVYCRHSPAQWTPTDSNGAVDLSMIHQRATMLYSTFWMLKIDEFTLCFRNGVNRKYGSLTHNLAYTDLVDWINQYCIESEQEIADRQGVDHEPEMLTSEQVIEEYRSIYKSAQQSMIEATNAEIEKAKMIIHIPKGKYSRYQKKGNDNGE